MSTGLAPSTHRHRGRAEQARVVPGLFQRELDVQPPSVPPHPSLQISPGNRTENVTPPQGRDHRLRASPTSPRSQPLDEAS
jgi:hypothetical protein